MLSKRLDLALLDGGEILARGLQRLALLGLTIVLAAGAWFALMAAFVLAVSPDAGWPSQLTLFGILNAASAIAILLLGAREGRPAPSPRATSDEDRAPASPHVNAERI